ACAGREVLHLGRDGGNALRVRSDDDRRDEARRDRYGDRTVGTAVLQQLVTGETDVALRHFDQRLGESLDQQIVDRKLHAAALEPCIELAAKLQKRIELDVDR